MKTITKRIPPGRMWKPLLRTLLLLIGLCFGAKMPNVQAQTVRTSVSHGNLIYEGQRGSAALYAADIHLLEEKISTIPERCFDPACYVAPRIYEAVNEVDPPDRYTSNTALDCQGCEEPEEFETPEPSDTEDEPEEPETSEPSDTEDEPEEPEITDPPGTGDAPEEPETPDPPDTGTEPEEPEAPDPPGTGAEPEEPEITDPPGTGAEPEEPEAPDPPGTGDTPEVPETPDPPDTEGTSGATQTEDLGYMSSNRFV